jgi:phenylpyruvate tautomerase PptA (4-oxalocrotonate tautomerase family)
VRTNRFYNFKCGICFGASLLKIKETPMPFIRTALPETMSLADRTEVVHGIHDALVTSINMPYDELFNLVTTYSKDDFFYSKTFNGIKRSENFITVEITMRRGRSDAMKRDLYELIVKNISQKTEISPKDVFIFIHENDYSDWSVGNGVFAMNLVQQRGTD